MKKIEIRADIVKNRLYMTLAGFFTDEELKQEADKAIEAIKKLKPGFDIINDIAQFKPTTPRGAEELKRTQQFAREAGARSVIRVVGSEGLAQLQLARKSKEVGYDADLAASVEEAEQMLDGER